MIQFQQSEKKTKNNFSVAACEDKLKESYGYMRASLIHTSNNVMYYT